MPIQSMCREFPELRVHLAHLRAMHYQRMAGETPVLPKLKTKPVAVKDDEDDLMIEVKLKLTPEVVDAFKATGRGWKEKINEVLVMLVGKEKTPA